MAGGDSSAQSRLLGIQPQVDEESSRLPVVANQIAHQGSMHIRIEKDVFLHSYTDE